MFDVRSNSIHAKAGCFLLSICFAVAVAATITTRKVDAIRVNSVNSTSQESSMNPQTKGKVNGKIVFISDRQDPGLKVWTMNADGSNPTQLTDEKVRDPSIPSYIHFYDEFPKFSPDGTKIAFRSIGRSNSGSHSIFVMNADGSDLRQIMIDSATLGGELGSFEWSPDGTKFLFDSGVYGVLFDASHFSDVVRTSGYRANIFVSDINGKNVARLTNDTDVLNNSATWSPDGKSIAFASNREGTEKIYVMKADGSNQHSVATGGYFSSPSWSPDGSKILFVGPEQYDGCSPYQYICSQLYTVSADGSQLKQLTNYASGYANPRYSPDGMKILFERRSFHYTYDRTVIFVMDADGGNQIDFSNRELGSSLLDAEPDWQPLSGPPNDPPPSVLGLKDGLYLASCFDTEISVNRSGNLNQTVSCAYQILATAPVPLSFGPGETSKVIRVYGTCDVSWDTKVSLLNNSGNATFLGGVKDTIVVFGRSNPIDNPAFFVRQQYRDFLGREPDSWGWDFWTNNMETPCTGDPKRPACASKRTDTSAAFFLSVEFQQTGYLIYRIYKAAYSDLPTAPVPIKLSDFLSDTQQVGHGVVVGQAGWEQALEANKQAFFSEFVQRSRFALTYPTWMTPVQFVDGLFSNAGVIPSVSERESAIGEFNGATGSADNAARARALRRVAENATLQQQEFNRAFVLMQYFGYLRRDPSSGPDTNFDGYHFWLNKLNQFNGDYNKAEMVKAFISSGEYRSRFSP